MYNKEIFKEEIELISNNDLRGFIIDRLDKIPSYFWTVPASTSGKHHPKLDLGEGGLVRHTKSCVQIGLDLLRSEVLVEDNEYNKDVIIASLLLHDSYKCGNGDTSHTEFLHPLMATIQFCNVITNDLPFKILLSDVSKCISSHMGKWNSNSNYYSTLPIPENNLQKLVHLADYIASRKYIDMNEINLF